MCPLDFIYNARLQICHLFRTGTEAPTQNYGEAYSYCQQYGENAHLLVLETEEEEQFLVGNFIQPNGEFILHMHTGCFL